MEIEPCAGEPITVAVGKPFVYETRQALSLHFSICAVQSEMLKSAPFDLALGYTQVMMWFLLLRPDPATVGVIGLGGGSLPKYCWQRLPNTRTVVAENNADVVAMREQFLIPPDDNRLEIRLQDGSDLVARNPGRFDALLVDGFDSSGIPAQLRSPAFYGACRASLRDEGVAIFNLAGSDHRCRAFMIRIARAFSGRCWATSVPGSDNVVVFAQRTPAVLPALEILNERARALATRHPLDFQPGVALFAQQGSHADTAALLIGSPA